MPSDGDNEVYRQRYETFRHFDRIRFQLLQILVAFGAAVALFFRFQSTPAEWWAFALIGFMLFLIGNAMLKVSKGLWANNNVLHEFAAKIGDTGVPKSAEKQHSVSYWTAMFVQLLSGLFLLIGFGELVF